jgi:ferredoxin/flavodoxin---NADP+ reductase
VRAVGYRSLPLADLPFDDRAGIVPNDAGRIVDPESKAPVPALYVTGWVKRGPTGLIGSNKPDGVETATKMLEDLAKTSPAEAPEPTAVDALLSARNTRVVDYAGWRRLDHFEVELGKPHGRPRVKIGSVEEMLAALERES